MDYFALPEDALPVVRGLALTRDDLDWRSVIMALICQGQLDLESIDLAHLIDFKSYFSVGLILLRDRQAERLDAGGAGPPDCLARRHHKKHLAPGSRLQCRLGPCRAAGHWRALGLQALRPALFGGAGGRPERSVPGGGLTMALFALGSSVFFLVGQWLLRSQGIGKGEWGIRLAAPAARSGRALWMGLVHDTTPWCLAV